MVSSRCGIVCGDCQYKGQMDCKECINIKKPFWGESCPLKDCCEQKGHEHCGLCKQFPCDMLMQFAYDKDQGDNGRRIEQCRLWASEAHEVKKPRYSGCLIAVSHIEQSKKFYTDVLGQAIAMDLGWNVCFEGGFSLQSHFAELLSIPPETVQFQGHNGELYFETEDFDMFMEHLEAYPDVELLHEPKTYEWKQRVVRLYDPDKHIIEIGESMAVIAKRYLDMGKTVEETAKIIQHPVEFVQAVKEGHL